MPRLILVEEGERRQLAEQIAALEGAGWPLAGRFEAGEAIANWGALFERAEGRGLFAQRQLLVVEGGGLGPFPEGLGDRLEGQDAEAVIIAVLPGDFKKTFPKGILASKKVTILKAEPSIPPWKRKDWLLGLAREKGYRLSPQAAALLGESIESQEELRAELDKLGLYAEGREVTPEDVRGLSFDEGGRALLTFLDGVCAADRKNVARSLRYLRAGPLLPVLTALCNRLRPALYLASFPHSPEAALKAIGMGAGKEYALRGARNALSAFGPAAVKRFMLMALRLSYQEKTSRAEGWPGFELILWDLLGTLQGKR